jgi:hypothetical protein
MANQGNNAEGVILVEIEGRKFGIDAAGNLVLNTKLTEPGAASRLGGVGLIGAGISFNCAISNAQGSVANHSSVTFQVQDVYGNAISGYFNLKVFLSDAATGVGLTATTASGGIAALAGGGTVLGALTTSKAVEVVTNANGQFVLDITDTAKTGFYPCVVLGGRSVQVGAPLTAGSYK